MKRAAFAVVLAGCAHKAAPPPTPEPTPPIVDEITCRQLAEHMIDVVAATPGLDEESKDEIANHREENLKALEGDCGEADPPLSLRQCVMGASTLDGIETCTREYREAQREPLPEGVHRPTADDLAEVTADLPGTGPLIATIETSLGTIHCTLDPEQAPVTVANFVGLARGKLAWVDTDGKVQKGVPFYDGLTIHRVIPEFMIQGGDPLADGTGGPGWEFQTEIPPGLSFDRPGMLAMANGGPDTNGSQFFVTEVATDWLDGQFNIFGHCDDLEVVKTIARVPATDERPNDTVQIKRVTVERGK